MVSNILIQQSDQKRPFSYNVLLIRVPFQILTSTLLSLVIPLSFLLLSRLTISNNLFNYPNSNPLYSLFFYTNLSLLHALVSIVSIATLFNALTGHTTLSTGPLPDPPTPWPALYPAWIFLSAFLVCVGLGVEVDEVPALEGPGLGYQRSLLSKVVFFLGLHETTLHWWRKVVKPVMDDTLFGVVRHERWGERVVMAVGLGGFWWWRLKGEVVALVVVAEVKRELLLEVGLVDLVGWWLYYVTVTVGMVRVVKGLIWIGIVLVFKRRRIQANDGGGEFSGNGYEEKV
ncbi:hypothetical protein LguiA_020207 [Lonicera macranthoides]